MDETEWALASFLAPHSAHDKLKRAGRAAVASPDGDTRSAMATLPYPVSSALPMVPTRVLVIALQEYGLYAQQVYTRAERAEFESSEMRRHNGALAKEVAELRLVRDAQELEMRTQRELIGRLQSERATMASARPPSELDIGEGAAFGVSDTPSSTFVPESSRSDRYPEGPLLALVELEQREARAKRKAETDGGGMSKRRELEYSWPVSPHCELALPPPRRRQDDEPPALDPE